MPFGARCPSTLDILPGRVASEAEAAAYFLCSEALANVAKYASASRVAIRIIRADGRLAIEVADDGVGGADPARGFGLRGLADRVEALGGTLRVDSPPGGGTRIEATIPLEPARAGSTPPPREWENRPMKAPVRWSGSAGVLRLVACLLALAAGITTVLLVPHSAEPPTTYGGASGLARAADVVAGLSLLAAGLALTIVRRRGWIGIVALLAGAAWFAPDWVGWEEAAPLLRSIAMVIAPFLAPLLLHLVLAAPAGVSPPVQLAPSLPPSMSWLPSSASARLSCGIRSSTGTAGATAPTTSFWCDRSRSSCDGCRPDTCSPWSPARWPSGRWWSRALPPRGGARQVVLPAVAGSASLSPSPSPPERSSWTEPRIPSVTSFAALFLARAAAVTALAGALGWSAYVVRRTRSAVARLAADLGEAPAPGSLRASLAASLGDPDVEVAYPLNGSGRFVDGAGNAVPPPTAGQGRVVTPIVRDGREIALVGHSRGDLAAEELAREIGAGARLAVENERLQAEVLAQLHDLQGSRARIVEAGDTARRRLERDLHDGAQQRLLALTYDLRLARTAAQSDGDEGLALTLERAVDEAHTALEELRELAHGIYPTILGEAGLGPALRGLADRAAIPVELTDHSAQRYPAPIETAGYILVDDAVAEAARRDATHALVRVDSDGSKLLVEVEDDGALAESIPLHVGDRVGALGGRVERVGRVLRADVPCA